ncbi:NUDIX hydrolase [Moorella thermoacetica]|uniref:GDP-mannose mannosyl hydrolase n=2 Tax=Neomoorella thermoacetica TaxID=1525 RepID=A0A1D7X8P0_NEOTH|nr:NUDIX hydrolase [Moorella thermoacetica]AKX93353.1 GDP-mannose mannosyl hydrolase [Moorella thermoacetica]AKX95995.1 GDP-mannose mannosyl hydrolase [Moorella thermoacetica]AOQ23262.1 GDP-mannose mannosyl hydrolase [Moorella thermoacetica]OIQ12031.1 GDP-mannose mannosyl hydrolase [Moorella thermoacetica]OIQ56081.1 GDP-mannose mannosyl hydrolase [Moorella thermoacetica]
MEKRCYPSQPLVGVGAVVVREEKLLLVRRGKPPSPGLWSLPGGAQETGETLPRAVEREVYEECGLIIAAGPPIAVLDSIYTDNRGRVKYHYVLIDFWAEYRGGSLNPADDATAACWVPLPKIADYPLTSGLKELLAEWGLLGGIPASPPTGVVYRTIGGQSL